VLLGGGYAAVVLGLGRLLGQNSSLVVAAATLAVAAAFQPARRRIQQLVDRRFNRRKYHTAQTIQAFSTRLRDQIRWTNNRGPVTPSPPSCWQSLTRPWSRPGSRSGFDLPPHDSSGTARSEAPPTSWAY